MKFLNIFIYLTALGLSCAMCVPAFIAIALQLPKDKGIINCNHERVTDRNARGLQTGNRLQV